MQFRSWIALAAIGVFLSACVTAPQKPVTLSQEALSQKNARVGIAMTALPKVDTEFPGASCLLCYGVASATHSTLTAHVQKLGIEDLPKLKDDLAARLKQKGIETVVISDAIDIKKLEDFPGKGENIATKNFTGFKQKYDIDRLVIIDITAIGMWRAYSAYIPAGDPKAKLAGQSYMVNLKNNSYEWYLPFDINKAAAGVWDEPPAYPGLTNAYYQTLELGKDQILGSFKN